MTALVTVVIVSYNTRDLLRRALTSLYADTSGGDLEIHVVDNASRDDSVSMVRHGFPAVHLISSPVNLGFGAANNLVLTQLETPYALLLNSDAEVTPGTIRALLDCMARHPLAGAVSCRLLNFDGTLQRSCWRFPDPVRALSEAIGLAQLLRQRSNYGEWDYGSERRVDFAVGACLLLRTAAILQVGFFDERFFMYSEETDLCRRLTRAGWEVWYTPACNVYHKGTASARLSTNNVASFYGSHDTYFRKWYGWPGVALLRFSQIIGAGLRIIVFAIASLIEPHGQVRERLQRQVTLLRWALRLPTAGGV